MINIPNDANGLHFRRARIDDRNLLKSWDKAAHVIAAGADDWEWEQDLQASPEWRLQLIVELKGEPIAFVQIIDAHEEESKYWHPIPPNYRAIDIWIGPEEFLNQGYGSQIMKLVIQSCFEDDDVEVIVIDPLRRNSRAIKFYERLGFQFLENRIMQEEEIYVMLLKKVTWKTH